MPLELPAWLDPAALPVVADHDAAMGVAIELSRENVARGTGGPFGAVVTDGAGRIVGAGVNVVVASGHSLAHGEVMALLDAQARLGSPRLNAVDGGPYTLVTSAQPCIMCFGTTFWAGLDAVVIGARGDEVEALTGFDEGPVPANWVEELAARDIRVVRDVRREEACAVLREYAAENGILY